MRTALVIRMAPVVALAACAGKQAPPPPKAVCETTSSLNIGQPVETRELPSPYWFQLLLAGYRDTGEINRPARDCSWNPVAWPADRCGAESSAEKLETKPLGPDDLLVTNLGGARRLIWVIT